MWLSAPAVIRWMWCITSEKKTGNEYMVEELTSHTPQDLADLDALMHELSATSFCNEELLNNALNDANVHVYVIRDEGHIVATGTLCIKHTLEFTIADIESVVVSSKCRGLDTERYETNCYKRVL